MVDTKLRVMSGKSCWKPNNRPTMTGDGKKNYGDFVGLWHRVYHMNKMWQSTPIAFGSIFGTGIQYGNWCLF